jgi:light-regulated signal transduction histidine kinase (bacteriophytochrome)
VAAISVVMAIHEKNLMMSERLHGLDRYPGAGVGLAICMKIVERHDGQIVETSENEKLQSSLSPSRSDKR